jgi:DNA-binding transcriptional MerR regulator
VGTDRLTIDELAAVVGMTTRNVRAHQSRGLVPPPSIEGRTGYYGPEHVRRLTQIRRLQDEGLNLAAIAKVLADGTLTRALVEPFVVEEPIELTVEELLEQLGIGVDDPAVERALELGFVELIGDGRARIAMPELLRASRDMSLLGVPLLAQLEAVATVRRATADVAAAFMELAEEHLVTRVAVEAGGDPAQIRTIVERLRTVAIGVTDTLFTQAMIDQLQQSLGQPTSSS